MSMKFHAARQGDLARSNEGNLGPGVEGSNNVLIGNQPALRLGDRGVHYRNGSEWYASAGAKRVLINKRRVQRCFDETRHTDAPGSIIVGDSHVLIGDYDQPSKSFPAKLEILILFEGGCPALKEPFELLDKAGTIVHSGITDNDGWLRVKNVEWEVYKVRLTSGFVLRVH